MASLFKHRFRGLNHQRCGGIILSLALTAAAILSVTVLPGCDDNSADNQPSYEVSTAPITTKAKDPISRDAVEKIVTHKLGDTGIAGQPVIRSITLTPEANGVFVSVELNRTASCHPGQLVATAATMAQQVMSAAFRYPDVSRVQLSLYGVTEAAKDKDTLAVRMMVTRAAATNIDWFAFNDINAEKVSTEFWVEPTIYANWKQYGGGAITDESQKAAANAAATPAQ